MSNASTTPGMWRSRAASANRSSSVGAAARHRPTSPRSRRPPTGWSWAAGSAWSTRSGWRRRHTLLRGWHCDHGARVDPPTATILRAETVPPYGGDTTWSNLAAAYAGLSQPVREFVDGLRAEHRLGVGYQPRPGDDAYVRHLLDHQVASVHPLVRVHPETGERVLFVNGYYLEQITDVSRAESAAILEMLLAQATRPEYTVRFRWEPGSVAFWDNRATIHLAPGDNAHLGFPRTMHRVMLTGDIPVGVDDKPSEPIVGTEPGRW